MNSGLGSGFYYKHRGASPRVERPPVHGICPKCGKIGVFTWAGAGMYRCHHRKCGIAVPREEIKDAPVRRVSKAKQNLLFEEGVS
jgi:hypothetical protein